MFRTGSEPMAGRRTPSLRQQTRSSAVVAVAAAADPPLYIVTHNFLSLMTIRMRTLLRVTEWNFISFPDTKQ